MSSWARVVFRSHAGLSFRLDPDEPQVARCKEELWKNRRGAGRHGGHTVQVCGGAMSESGTHRLTVSVLTLSRPYRGSPSSPAPTLVLGPSPTIQLVNNDPFARARISLCCVKRLPLSSFLTVFASIPGPMRHVTHQHARPLTCPLVPDLSRSTVSPAPRLPAEGFGGREPTSYISWDQWRTHWIQQCSAFCLFASSSVAWLCAC